MNEAQVKELLAAKAAKAEKTERKSTGTNFAACGAILNTKGDRCDAVAVVAVLQETEKWACITRGCEIHAAAFRWVKASISHSPITVGGAR